MNLGAEPKKIALLGGLLLVAGGVFYYNVIADDSPSSSGTVVQPASAPAPAAAPVVHVSAPKTERRRVTNQGLANEFKPRMGPKNPEDRPDPATIDPTLRLDLLAKIQAVQAGAAGRNLFVFGAAPPPPVKELPKVGKIEIAKNQPPATAPIAPAGPPPPPQAPPITFKYYGYKISTSDGHKAAFLLDGDDILIAGENDTVKRRYRVVKIGVNSITIEDTQFKSTQTLQLQENPAA
ncbi:MAG TPA: hypothetical protein VHB50_07975 [Bryobacteraceae bacterium]|nr:hypothetical protein [Bryobacteraceae bacterium]